ncbi:MAG: hypothetical protein ACXW0Q_15315 [Methylovulum sp.]
MLTTGQQVPALCTWAFANEKDIDDSQFELAAIQLALARFPRVFFPEILGFTFAYCQSQSLLAFSPVSENTGISHFLNVRQNCLTAQIPAIIEGD